MPIELPNLDDRTFTDLLDEGHNMIPALAPSWTDHNPSDPGITVLEAFAAVTEQLIYRTNRVTNAHKNVFLRLISPPKSVGSTSNHPNAASDVGMQQIDDQLANAIRAMRVETRAVTAADYERLACEAGAVRARCYPRSEAIVEKDGRVVSMKSTLGHVTLVVASKRLVEEYSESAQQQEQLQQAQKQKQKQQDETLLVDIKSRLKYSTALTIDVAPIDEKQRPTLHVVLAQPLAVTLTVKLVCLDDYRANAGTVLAGRVSDTLRAYFDIESGGPAHQGWPLGQVAYKSTLYALISEVVGVDYIVDLELTLTVAKTALASHISPAGYEYIDMNVVCDFVRESDGKGQ